MLTFDQESGNIVIDFETGPVTVRPPKFGAMRRLRAERSRINLAGRAKMEAWDAEHAPPAPEGEDAPPEDPLEQARLLVERSLAQEEVNLDGAVEWWSLVLKGDDNGSFVSLVDAGTVPDDSDDWPADLLYDFRPTVRGNVADLSSEEINALQPVIDQIFRHWGKARFRSGPTPGQNSVG